MASDRTGNVLLDATTTLERGALLKDARRRPINVGDVARSKGDQITSVYFPTSGTMSLIVDEDGESIEAATVGREGVSDIPSALGSRISSHTLLNQVQGEAFEVDVEILNKVYAEGPTFGSILGGYAEALFCQATISAACLGLHHVNERCARWLLETHDRIDADTFELKHEFLARMLGVHRPSVSLAANSLQAAGLITYRRGKITILDRRGLEDASCSCYESNRHEYSRLVPLTGG